ncbi:amino acid ABC transporter permease [Thermobrachium celere]|uniref:Probable amino acid ABC transporter n=1 Tax=Thermobrachium celere DSM 8682 TaxID=941824 RepID=R7RTM9_9CLOT|nr:amino acid ABC transporter permease [Thermobrachium celere]GFR34204.1 amino acid ABC transporter permease [Thermobrachium celere]CDF58643.1 probable amino acid ABC transporter [Thermobrachium celere DSM 8682]
MNFDFLTKYYSFFIQGTKFTVFIAFFSVILGIIFGTILSLMRISNNKILKVVSTSYIEFMRGTPLLVQLFIIYYGLDFSNLIGGSFGDIASGIVTLSLNSAAYVAEIIRSGIQSVDKGQMEAARSLGMTYKMAMRYVIYPQAFKNILPALVNEFIVVIKESSIVSIIGIHELMYNADTVRGVTFRPFEPLIIAAIIYFILTTSLSRLLGNLERRLKLSD